MHSRPLMNCRQAHQRKDNSDDETAKTLTLIAVAMAAGVAGLFWSGEITSMTGLG